MKHVFCLIGPSGTGKDTIKKMIEMPYLVSYRTRKKREEEIDGIHGRFISEAEFDRLDQQSSFVAKTLYAGSRYGITSDQLNVLKYSSVLYVVDWNGAVDLKKWMDQQAEYNPKQVVTIFIESPYELLAGRMRHQGREQQEIEKRMNQYWDVDYPTMLSCDHVVYNAQGKQQETAEKVKSIIRRYDM